MKINWNNPIDRNRRVKPSFTKRFAPAIATFWLILVLQTKTFAQSTAADTISMPERASSASNDVTGAKTPPRQIAQSTPQALAIVDQVLHRLAYGQPFQCNVRQVVRAAGKEAIGTGTYLQVGNGTGQFSMNVTIRDGDAKHVLMQVSDGRIAYTQTEIGGRVSLTRVEVGALDEGARVQEARMQEPQTRRQTTPLRPSMLVGGPSEMLDSIRRDYSLRVGKSELKGQKLIVLMGTIKPLRKNEIVGSGQPPELFPTHVNVMIAEENHSETGFGRGLPIRIEHRGAPTKLHQQNVSQEGHPDAKHTPKSLAQGHLISLLEFYSIGPLAIPKIDRFQFNNPDPSVEPVNITQHYKALFDIKVSNRERARYFHRFR